LQGVFWVTFSGLDDGDAGSLQTLGALFNCELDPLAFIQIAEPITKNSGVVYEYILAIFALNESVAFATIEPLDRTKNSFRHFVCLLMANSVSGAALFSVVVFKKQARADVAQAVIFRLPDRTYMQPYE
jgi:hypothetical protein